MTRPCAALLILLVAPALVAQAAPPAPVSPSADVPQEEYVHDCGLVHPDVQLEPVPRRPHELPLQRDERPRVARVAPGGIGPKQFGSPSAKLRQGALSGKTVYLSPGHGFYWSPTLSSGAADNIWRTQRPNTFGVVEDLISTEALTQFLVPMLVNAGAYVVTMRESDTQTRMVVVDDVTADYREEGPAATFSTSTLPGYGPVPDPLPSGTNPFALGDNRLMEASALNEPTASATWTFDVPADGHYNVYVSYTQYSYRVPDAHYVVRHAGGEAHFRVNQRRHGSTWVLLGRFFFRQGKDAQKGAVVALNDSSVVGNVSLDAVRLGGGMGIIARPRSDGTTGHKSGRPRFEECSRYHAQYMGAPPTVYSASSSDRNDDITARSRFTAWDHEPGDDGVYVAWHTNACGSTSCTARGTETYVYGPNGPPSPVSQFSGVPGSVELAQAVQGEIIRDLRGVWDPYVNAPTQWANRGIFSAYFGELNPNFNPETPAILLEMAFHNNPNEADVLKEPFFRYVAARAIAQGIIKYYAQRDGLPVVLPHEPPVRLQARNLGNGQVRVAWGAGPTDAADLVGGASASYVLYGSADGEAWDDGLSVTGTQIDLPLSPGQVRYFRVTGVNGGGESFPSETVGAMAPAWGGASPVLIINAYDRFDASLARTENLSAHGLAQPTRVLIERMNDGTYIRRHGAALAALGVGFDSAVGGALTSNEITLTGYALVDFLAGRGASGTAQLQPSHRDRLAEYVEGGGRLLLSGSHVAAGLSAGAAQDQHFLSNILRAGKGSGAGTQSVNGSMGEAFDGLLDVALDDGSAGAYPVGTADVLTPMSSRAIARWGTGDDVAAVLGEGTHRVAFLSFPFETVNDAQRRTDLMARLLTALEVPMMSEPPPPTDGGTTQPEIPVEPEPVVLTHVTGDYEEAGGCGCTGGGAGIALFGVVALGGLARRRRDVRR